LGRYASAKGIQPGEINNDIIEGLMTAVREGSLHQNPKALHRQVTLIWNEAAQNPELGLKPVTVASFRGPPKRVDLSLLPASFIEDRDSYLSWCAATDPFAVDARPRPLAARTLKLSRDQIHAGVTALVKSGTKPQSIRSLADLVTVHNFKGILRQRLADAGGQQKSFNHYLARAIVRIAREWVKVDASVLVAINAGEDGSIVVGKILEKDAYAFGYDAQTGEYGNLVSKGIIDPTKVVRVALQGAASVAGLLITTEAMVAELPKKEGSAMPGGAGGGMGGMGGMDF
jgi:hypothetical protein